MFCRIRFRLCKVFLVTSLREAGTEVCRDSLCGYKSFCTKNLVAILIKNKNFSVINAVGQAIE